MHHLFSCREVRVVGTKRMGKQAPVTGHVFVECRLQTIGRPDAGDGADRMYLIM